MSAIPAPMMGGVASIMSKLGPLGPKSSFFVQTVAENSKEYAELLTQAGTEGHDELLSQVSKIVGIDKEEILTEIEKESGLSVDQFLMQVKSMDLTAEDFEPSLLAQRQLFDQENE